jgi:hypothetical protein
MLGFLSIQTTKPNEKFVYMGNRVGVLVVGVLVEAIGTYRLVLDTWYHLDLFQILYVSLFSQNVVSLSKLDKVGYCFKSRNECFSLFKHNHLIGSGFILEIRFKNNQWFLHWLPIKNWRV